MKQKLFLLTSIFFLSIFTNLFAQAPGNNCANAVNLTLPAIGNTIPYGQQTTLGRGNNFFAGSYCASANYGGGEDGVYSINVPAGGGSFTFSFAATNGNTWKILSIHTGCAPTTANCVGGFTTGGSSDGTTTIFLEAGTYYLIIDTFPSPDYATFNLSITFNAPPTSYCIPAPTSLDGQGITNVSFSTVNNTTGAEAGNYGNYSALIGTGLEGVALPVNITYRTGYTYNTTVWVDWNDDFIFSPSEVVYTGESTGANPTTLAASFIIPVGTATSGNGTGLHRMRIGGRDSGTVTDPCYTGSYGCFEDYSLQVLVPATPTITSLSGTEGCTGSSLTINGTNLTSASSVTIGGTAATITANTANSITVTVGNGTTGPIVVTTPGGTATSATTFTVNALPALPPNNTLTSNSPQCNPPGVTITQPGSAPAGITWYWQTAANGTSIANNAATPLIVTTSGRTHIRAQNNTTGCWSTGSRFINVIVNNATPNAATAPSPANNSTGVCYSGSSPITSISWGNVTNVTSYDVYFGTNPTPPMVSNQITLTYNTGTLAANTTYYWRIVPKNACGDTTATVTTWSFTTANGPCHCTPTSTNTGDYISNFSTTGGFTNISNPSGGLSGTGYGDFYATHSASQVAGGTLNFTENYNGGNHGFSIWVDFNNNGVFETAERLYNAGTTAAGFTGTVTIPMATTPGDYRMRIRAWYGSLNPDPCTNINWGEAEDYRLTVISLTPCSGTPTGGTVTVSPSSGNPGSIYGVTATGYTIGTGLTYQWQYSDTGGEPWTDRGTATNSYIALTGLVAPPTLGVIRTWRLVVTCTASGFSNYSSTGTFTTALTPCTPTNTYSTSYYISGVTTTGGVANINNTPTGFSAYTDYTSIFVSQYPGSNFTINATHPSSTYGYNVWVDWNNDGDFDDADENVISTGYLGTPAALGPITIPGAQTPGNYRMRIRNAYLDNPAPACGSHNYGEAEDYTVTVLTLNCIANPQDLTAISSTTTTATISWNDSAPPPANGYEYIISTDNTTNTPAGDITGTTTGTIINLTGLTPSTTYYVFVRSICNTTDNGAWITVEFSTGCTDTVSSPTLCPTIIIDEQGNNPFLANPFELNPSVSLDCATSNITLVANPNLRATTSYLVEKINYPSPAPEYDFDVFGGNQQAIHTDDHWADARTDLRFPFCFYNNSYTQTLVGANGMITFNNTITPGSSCGWSFNDNLPSVAGDLFEQTIYGVYHDINPAGLPEDAIRSRTIGTAPCRQFQVSWNDIPMFSDSSRLYTGMIVLHETTNIIEVFIKEKRIENGNVSPWNGGNAIVGIQGDITPLGPNNQYAVAPCRNGLDTNWETTNEAWRFTPNGAAILPTNITWYQGSVATGNEITANADNSVTVSNGGSYFAVADFNTCSGPVTLTDEIVVNQLSKTWMGYVNNNWYLDANWQPNGVPTPMDCVLIPDATISNIEPPIANNITQSAYALNLTLAPTASLEIASNTKLVVTDFVHLDGTINIRDSGSLIQINEGLPNINNNTGTGAINMQRTATIASSYDYIYWSSPVVGFGVTNVSPGSSHIYEWIPTITTNGVGHFGDWRATTENMLSGKGYIIRNVAGTPTPSTPEFVGLPNNGVITKTITRGDYNIASPLGDYTGGGTTMATRLDDNWNLVGNPYPSAISADIFIAVNAAAITDDINPSLAGTVYLWRHLAPPSTTIDDPFYDGFVYNYNPNDYLAYNSTGPNPNDGFNGNIAAGQGFFVLMEHTAPINSNITFNNSMRNETLNNGLFYRTNEHTNRTSDIEKHRIWLDLIAPNNRANSILVGYVENATNGIDRLFDGFELSETSTRFYSLIEDEKMAIQGKALPFMDSDLVPLGLLIPQAGNYTIAINSVDGLFEGPNQDIFLEDTYIGIIHDLRIAPYSFNTNEGTFNNRFILRYTNETLSMPDEQILNGVLISAPSNNYIQVTSGMETIKQVTIYDVLGRNLFNNKNINEKELILDNLSLSNGAYIVKVTLGNGLQKTQKVVLK